MFIYFRVSENQNIDPSIFFVHQGCSHLPRHVLQLSQQHSQASCILDLPQNLLPLENTSPQNVSTKRKSFNAEIIKCMNTCIFQCSTHLSSCQQYQQWSIDGAVTPCSIQFSFICEAQFHTQMLPVCVRKRRPQGEPRELERLLDMFRSRRSPRSEVRQAQSGGAGAPAHIGWEAGWPWMSRQSMAGQTGTDSTIFTGCPHAAGVCNSLDSPRGERSKVTTGECWWTSSPPVGGLQSPPLQAQCSSATQSPVKVGTDPSFFFHLFYSILTLLTLPPGPSPQLKPGGLWHDIWL